MQPFNRNIQLKLRSRPLRLAYLVDSKDDLKNAVTLYTHTWGGAVGAILPTPKDENNIKELKVSLTRVDPDYIFTSDQELPSYIEKFLEKYPAIRYSISEDKICRYIQCKGEIALHTGTLSTGITRASIPHIISVLRHLYPDPSNDTNFYFIEPDSTFELELMLQGGILSQHYRDSLIKHFGAKAFFLPQDTAQLFKTSLSLTTSNNPVSLTLADTHKQIGEWSGRDWLDQPNAVCLFLNDRDDISLASAFWNARWFCPFNKLFLTKNDILNNLEYYTKLLLNVVPKLEAIQIATILDSQEEAEDLYNFVKTTLTKAGKSEIKV